ncbi:MAG: ROK family transcriptional regulator [Rhizobiales bacterium]|nr:ROK family transcriptional regulator [Hyphomicrobiales bacterium]
MALKGTNQEFGRPYNRRIVLETIRLHGPIARGDIARHVGLTVQTVSNIIRELEELNFVAGSRQARKARGYPATSLAINPDGGFAIGVHVTPFGIEAALINIAGEVIASDRRNIPHLAPARALEEIAGFVARFRALRPGGRMLGVGLAMPGPFDVEAMSFVGPTTLEGWQEFPIAESLEAVAGLPSFIEVDHAAAALGERLYGAGRAFRDFYYLYFGVGLGGCQVQDGQPVRGAFRNAGEIGHISLVPGGEACPCGNRGCLERYLSLEAHDRRAPVIGTDGWIAETAPLLRAAIATIENLFDPETIIIGGLAPDELLGRLLAAAEPLPSSISERRDRTAPRVTRSLAGPGAVLRGAAALAVAGVLSPRFGLLFARDDAGPARDPVLSRTRAA